MFHHDERPDWTRQEGRGQPAGDGSSARRQIDCSPRGVDDGPRRIATRRGTPQREWTQDGTHDRS